MKGLRDLVVRWRAEAQRLRVLEAHGQAAALEQAANELEAEIAAHESALLTIAEAAEESGYSEEHLRRLARDGDLPVERANGSKSRMRVRRGDLPIKGVHDGRGDREPVDFLEEDARSIAKARSSS
ncbi:MAG: hypothetical protein AMS25_09055 [Gemmatimonas sp. SM23_52]|jgi:hypothetical protein|nr:MAG: hypothetical protein AMS25_09055 [Gemmatimonas sp. SM23_52]